MYQAVDVLADPAKLRHVIGPIYPSQDDKVIDHIDRHCRAWIERCPFVVVTTVDSEGRLDASPKGDPPGFVKVLDQKTLAIPDRPGNRRADSLVLFNRFYQPDIDLDELVVVPNLAFSRTHELRSVCAGPRSSTAASAPTSPSPAACTRATAC
ncbi:MAG: hypothetical protein HC888_07020 [Candidatus Competibacteraceae bacterium]|nr:hypothetical protein [Candidatus Competibacteraceae bacterium]